MYIMPQGVIPTGSITFQVESTTITNLLLPTSLFLMTHHKNPGSVTSVSAQIYLRHKLNVSLSEPKFCLYLWFS